MNIDLMNVASAKDLHRLFKERLGFPGFYGMNWDAFWDAVTGLTDMPDRLILNNWEMFLNKLPEEGKTLAAIIIRYNDLNAQKKIICK